jgi:diguanylate cyclase (GGDEF)-like protein
MTNKDKMAVSVTRLAYRRAVIIVLVLIAGVLTNIAAIYYDIKARDTLMTQRLFDRDAQLVGQVVKFYRDVLAKLATQQEVRDVLAFGGESEAETWALRQRSFLPNSIGLALVSQNKKVMGAPVELQVGPACLRDLKHRLDGEALPEPFVHRDNPDLAHFDLTTPVTDTGGAPVGLVFASFSLRALQTALDEMVYPEQILVLRDSAGEIIGQAGHLSEPDNAVVRTIKVPDTTWTFELTQPEVKYGRIMWTLGWTNVVATALIVLLFLTLIARVLKLFMSEFGNIRAVLDQIGAGQFSGETPAGQIEETADVMPVINQIAQNIHTQQLALAELSLTDELTRLPNRRGFNRELQRAFDLANRDLHPCLAVIDIDHFKEMNDSGGHEVGDRVLQALAETLRQQTRKVDFAARLGGDEFAVIFSRAQVADMVARLGRVSDAFVERQKQDPGIARHGLSTLSVGLTCFDPQRDETPDDVLRRADRALYQAKANGRNRIELIGSGSDGCGSDICSV